MLGDPICSLCGVADPDPEYGVLWSYVHGCWLCGDCVGVEDEE